MQKGAQPVIDISGSSTLFPLSAQISKCAAQTIKIELAQIDSGNTVSGLQDLCQGKVKLFGANREVNPDMMTDIHCGGIDLEKFEVARYALVVIINKKNPHAEEMQSSPLSGRELTNLLLAARSWKDIREYWQNEERIVRLYPPLESGEFEIVKNSLFPGNMITQSDVPGLSIESDKQAIIDNVIADANAVGIVDYSSYQRCQNKNQLSAIPVNGMHVSSAIINGSDSAYPLAVTLYLYAERNAYETDKTLRSFINYYLSHELDFLDKLGYLYPSKKGYAGNRDTVP